MISISRRARVAASAATATLAAVGLFATGAAATLTGIDPAAMDPNAIGGHPAQAVGLYRFAGSDRAETSRVTSIQAHLEASATELGTVALLAGSADFPDALAAAPLAGALSAPVLLANPDGSLSGDVLARLREYNTVIVVSGTSVLSDDVVHPIRDEDTSLIRYSGGNRYETAAALALAAMYWDDRATHGDVPTTGMDTWAPYLADGTDFPDALAAGPAAARIDNGSVLLTAGSSIPVATMAALDGRFSELTYTDPSAMEGMLSWWNALNGERKREIVTVGSAATAAASGMVVADSVVGKDRYETAALLGGRALNAVIPTVYTLASGQSFADAIVGGAVAANAGGPLLLVTQNGIPAATDDVLSRHVSNKDGIVVVGGPGSVSTAVSSQLARSFTW